MFNTFTNWIHLLRSSNGKFIRDFFMKTRFNFTIKLGNMNNLKPFHQRSDEPQLKITLIKCLMQLVVSKVWGKMETT